MITVTAKVDIQIKPDKQEIHIVTSIIERGEWREVSRIIRHGHDTIVHFQFEGETMRSYASENMVSYSGDTDVR